jgi:hypothetical protein
MKLSRSRSPFWSKVTSISTLGYCLADSETPCMAAANALRSNLPTFSVTTFMMYTALRCRDCPAA